MLKAAKFMTRSVVALDVDLSVAEALQISAERRVSCLPVLDGAHRLVAVLDERELLRALVSGTATTVGQLVGSRTVSVPESAEAEEVAAAILENDVPGAAVMSGAELVGIVTRGDALRALLRERATRFDAFEGTRGWRVSVDDGIVTIAGPSDLPSDLPSDAPAVLRTRDRPHFWTGSARGEERIAQH